MRSSAAARRYARALFSLAQESDQVAGIRGELESVQQLFERVPELKAALFRPLHPVKERAAVLTAVCARAGLQVILRSFMLLLIDQRRLVEFEGICDEFERLADEAAGRVRAELVSSSPLSDEQRGRLERALAAQTGHRIALTAAREPAQLTPPRRCRRSDSEPLKKDGQRWTSSPVKSPTS
jgi:F-type H+-transporting ATPase subunit delta